MLWQMSIYIDVWIQTELKQTCEKTCCFHFFFHMTYKHTYIVYTYIYTGIFSQFHYIVNIYSVLFIVLFSFDLFSLFTQRQRVFIFTSSNTVAYLHCWPFWYTFMETIYNFCVNSIHWILRKTNLKKTAIYPCFQMLWLYIQSSTHFNEICIRRNFPIKKINTRSLSVHL